MIGLHNIVSKALDKEFPFVIYRKPNLETIVGVFQKDNKINYTSNLDLDGFVFAPFDDRNKTLIIPYSNASKMEFIFEESTFESTRETNFASTQKNKNIHIELVEKGIDFIQNSNVTKVVLSRKESVNVGKFELVETFKELCANYPNAFVYAWFHPKSGLWMGATPERLLSVKDNKFKVMALASTQEFKGSLDVQWGLKEQQEHQIVVDYIALKIKDFKPEISKTYTVKAGNLLHLRADINGIIPEDNIDFKSLIGVLHPTPAICGMPKIEAKKFILENENYNREFYTGFLGEMNGDSIDLYVNLRCMKVNIQNKVADIFIGGGITKDSNPEKEWLETVAKTKIMKKVLL